MAIVITGTPCTGKTELAKKISEEKGLKTINITELLRERGLDTEWDAKRHCFIVDVVELTRLLNELMENDSNIIIEGHLSHYLEPRHVTRCIVTKTDLKELKRRLEARGYDDDKVRENLDCEIFDTCHQEAMEHGHSPEVIWTG